MTTKVTIDICLIRLITGIEGNIRHCSIPHTPWELCCILGLCVNKLLRQMCFYKINNCFTKSYFKELISWGFLFATRLVIYFWKELIYILLPQIFHVTSMKCKLATKLAKRPQIRIKGLWSLCPWMNWMFYSCLQRMTVVYMFKCACKNVCEKGLWYKTIVETKIFRETQYPNEIKWKTLSNPRKKYTQETQDWTTRFIFTE